ncbi:MAG: glycosyltransferase, partial [Candidatus Fervidibacter sp.]|uniref:glycosyltransferase n=1 Tax=Candidatus Fervidibacter sp. TaxID=3100871 RepID=UPI00404A199A
MRLLFLIHSYPPDLIGGHEIRCQRTAEGLRQRGHDVLVLTTFKRENGPRKEGHVWRLLRSKWSEDPKRSAFKWVFVYRHNVKVFNRVVKEFQPEIICRWNLNWCTAAFVNYVHEHAPCPIVTFIGGVPIGRNWSVLEDLWTHFCKTKPKAFIRRWVKNLLVRIASIWIPTSPQNVVYEVATFLSHFDLKLSLKYGMQVTKPVVIYAGVDVQKFSPRSPK